MKPRCWRRLVARLNVAGGNVWLTRSVAGMVMGVGSGWEVVVRVAMAHVGRMDVVMRMLAVGHHLFAVMDLVRTAPEHESDECRRRELRDHDHGSGTQRDHVRILREMAGKSTSAV